MYRLNELDEMSLGRSTQTGIDFTSSSERRSGTDLSLRARVKIVVYLFLFLGSMIAVSAFMPRAKETSQVQRIQSPGPFIEYPWQLNYDQQKKSK